MKLNKVQVNKNREALCKVLIVIAKHQTVANNIKKDLADDFDMNEQTYRDGVVTPAGVLYRKPRFEVSAKEKVDIEAA